MRQLLDGLLALVFPERCPACDAWLADEPGLCPRCSESLYELGTACDVCAEPLPAARATTCARCRASPPPFSRIFVPYRYGGELATAVCRLKYGRATRGRGRAELARPLGILLAPVLDRAVKVGRSELLVPVPLHPRRLRERGFSQALLLAATARAHARLRAPPELAPGALARVRDTADQAGLGRNDRQRNVDGAFAVPPQALGRVADRRVLLVDDVVTTGATAAACAWALRAAGAASVDVLALARAEG